MIHPIVIAGIEVARNHVFTIYRVHSGLPYRYLHETPDGSGTYATATLSLLRRPAMQASYDWLFA
jgi:hypothetical protein